MPSSATLQISYGSYVHDVGECELSYRRFALTGESGNPWAERIDIELSGVLVGDSITDMDAKVRALIAAYAYNGNDFRVIDNRGLDTKLTILSSRTNGGIRIISPPSFPSNRDAAYVTFLPYQIALTAELPVTDPATVLERFEETLNFSGGGAVYQHLETRLGLAQKQRTTRFSVYKVVQEGQAVGLYTTPLVPNPIWPDNLVRAPQISKIGGKLVGAGAARKYMHKGVRWRYEFESALPMFGEPNHWERE